LKNYFSGIFVMIGDNLKAFFINEIHPPKFTHLFLFPAGFPAPAEGGDGRAKRLKTS